MLLRSSSCGSKEKEYEQDRRLCLLVYRRRRTTALHEEVTECTRDGEHRHGGEHCTRLRGGMSLIIWEYNTKMISTEKPSLL